MTTITPRERLLVFREKIDPAHTSPISDCDAALVCAAGLVSALANPSLAFDEAVIAPITANLARQLIALGYIAPPSPEKSRVQDA